MKYITYNKKSFTLIEVLVAITIFTLVAGAAMGIFVFGVKGKQKVNQLKEIEDNARYAMELMSREIRMASWISPGPADGSRIVFTDSSDVLTEICRAESDGVCNRNGDYLAKWKSPAVATVFSSNDLITSNKVKITNLIFYVNGFDLTIGPQPRITISMTVSSADGSVSMDFQTTVSPRIY